MDATYYPKCPEVLPHKDRRISLAHFLILNLHLNHLTLNKCLDANEKRIGIRDVLKHPWIPENFNQTKERFKAEDFARLYKKPLTDFSHIQPGQFTTKNSLIQMVPYSSSARILLKIGRMAVRFMTHSSLEDPESKMMLGGIEEGNIETVCNQSGGFISHKFIERI